MRTNIQCDCGSTILNCSLKKHLLTKKHVYFQRSNNTQIQPQLSNILQATNETQQQEEKECVVCYTEMTQQAKVSCCSACILCYTCYNRLNRCPCCRNNSSRFKSKPRSISQIQRRQALSQLSQTNNVAIGTNRGQSTQIQQTQPVSQQTQPRHLSNIEQIKNVLIMFSINVNEEYTRYKNLMENTNDYTTVINEYNQRMNIHYETTINMIIQLS